MSAADPDAPLPPPMPLDELRGAPAGARRRGVMLFLAGVVAGLLLVAGVLFVYVRYSQNREGTPEKAPPKDQGDRLLPTPVFPAPAKFASWQLKLWSLDGKPFDPSVFKGKTVFLSFWATWCGPCRREMPAIQRLFEKAAGDGIVFAAISEEPNVQVRRFVDSSAYTLLFLHMSEKPPEVFRTRALPTTFIIAPDGRIAFHHVGAARWDDDSVLAFLRSLSAVPPTKP